MGTSEFLTNYQIDEADYTHEYAQNLLAGCEKMNPGKKIIASLEFIRNQVVMSVYVTDPDKIENHP